MGHRCFYFDTLQSFWMVRTKGYSCININLCCPKKHKVILLIRYYISTLRVRTISKLNLFSFFFFFYLSATLRNGPSGVLPTEHVLTMAAFTAQSFLKACCSVHARLAAWNHDLVGVGFGAGEGWGCGVEGRVSYFDSSFYVKGTTFCGSLQEYSLGGDVHLLQLAVCFCCL